MTRDIVVSKFVKMMESKGFIEIARWPMHIQDSQIIGEIEKDEKLSLYASFGGGVPLCTHASVKSFFAYIPNKHPQSRQNRVYSSTRLKEKRPQDQKDFDLSFLEDPSG